jgi:hypothetical protein
MVNGTTLRLTVDAETVPLTEVLAASAGSAPLLVLTGRALGDLAAELGGHDAAMHWLADLAASVSKPVAVNISTGPDTSTTVWLAPPGWTSERLAGWVAGHHEEIEAEFGPVTVRTMEAIDAAR